MHKTSTKQNLRIKWVRLQLEAYYLDCLELLAFAHAFVEVRWVRWDISI